MKNRSRRQGAIVVEFALVAPALFLILFALVDWSWYMFQWMTLIHAVQVGARAGAGTPTDEGPSIVAEASVQAHFVEYGFHDDGAVIVASLQPSMCGQVLRVQVDAPYVPLTGLVGVPSSISGSASACWYGDASAGL